MDVLSSMAAKVVYNNSNSTESEDFNEGSTSDAMLLTTEDTINVDKFKVR